MQIVLVGLNYQTASIELRERVHLNNDALCSALTGLQHLHTVAQSDLCVLDEVVILSTCNRLEVYAVCDESEEVSSHIVDYLARHTRVAADELWTAVYVKTDHDAMMQLFRVACGLDSIVLGEAQILGQVKSAHAQALNHNTCGAVLDRLFGTALHLGKQARTETDIGDYAVSVSYAAVDLVRQRFSPLADKHVAIIGTGQMGILAARTLRDAGVERLSFINRTYDRAAELANDVGGQAYGWAHLHDALYDADVIFTATGAPHSILHSADFALLRDRYGSTKHHVVFDLAVPRDVEASVETVGNVTVYNVDDLQNVVTLNLQHRQASVPQVEQLIEKTLYEFKIWLETRQVVPVLVSLRRKIKSIAATEAEDALRRLRNADDHDREVVTRLVHRLVNKMLHQPTTRLKAAAASDDVDNYMRIIEDLFALQDESMSGVHS